MGQKTRKSIKPEDRIPGSVYLYDGYLLVLWGINASGTGIVTHYIKPKTKVYKTYSSSLGDLKSTTLQEKAHMLACVAADKYVEPPTLKLEIPEDMDNVTLVSAILNNL